MAKADIISSIRDIVKRPSTATISALDPAEGESPVVWTYTIWDLFGSFTNPSKGRMGPTGIDGLGSALWQAREAILGARVQNLADTRPACPGAARQQTYTGVQDEFSQYLPGVFSILGVPFGIGEPKMTGNPWYERNYVPSYSMRVRTELECIKAGKGYLNSIIPYHGWTWDLDLERSMGALCPEGNQYCKVKGDDGFAYVIMQPLEMALLWINEHSGKYGADPKLQKNNWIIPDINYPWLLLKSISPTRDEWTQPWGAYKFFARGGFIVDEAFHTGDFNLERFRDYPNALGNHMRGCAAWCRDTSVKDSVSLGTTIPSGMPVCVVPAMLAGDEPNVSDQAYWGTYVDIQTGAKQQPNGSWLNLYKLKVIPHWESKLAITTVTEWMVSAIGRAFSALCGHKDDIAKATAAAIAFAKLQGKTAQDAKTKAKTGKDVANAAELAAQYSKTALELQIAVATMNLACGAFMSPDALPPIDLPGVEPPPNNPKFNVQEMLESIKYTGKLSLSPQPSPHGLSKGWLLAIGAIAAGAGAYAVGKKP